MSATLSSFNRRGFHASSAAAGVASVFPSAARAAMHDGAIRPFHIDVPEEVLIDLRRRVLATRWPDKETVADQSQGCRSRPQPEFFTAEVRAAFRPLRKSI